MAYDFMGSPINVGDWIIYCPGRSSGDMKLGLVLKVSTQAHAEAPGYYDERNRWVYGPRPYTYLRVQGIDRKERTANRGVGRVEHPSTVARISRGMIPAEWREAMRWALEQSAEGRRFLAMIAGRTEPNEEAEYDEV